VGNAPIWIRDTADLVTEMGRIGRGPLAVDTEADSLHHYPEKVCLLQLSHHGRDLLVDPLAGVDLRALGPLFADREVRKIFHGADYDLRLLHREYGLEVSGLFDTMIAARLTGERVFGLAAMLEARFAVRLDKRFQRADWSRRPLDGEMEAYAAADTRWLEPLAELLERGLLDLGRASWAAEEFRRVERVRWVERDDEDALRRVKGSATLDRRGLGLLAELVRYREQRARELDRPPFRILRDEVLLRLARHCRDASTLRSETARVTAREREGVAAALLRGLETADERLPELRRGGAARPSADRVERLRRLARQREALAARLGLEPSVLATRQALGEWIDGVPPGRAESLRTWQADLLAGLGESRLSPLPDVAPAEGTTGSREDA